MRVRRKPGLARLPLSLSVVLVLASTASAAFKNDFSGYPQDSRNCLVTASDSSGCNGDTVQEMNTCLCGNQGNFVLSAASCIAKSASWDLDAVYTTMSGACAYSKTPLAISQEEFVAAGGASSTGQTTTKPTPTPRPTTKTVATTVSGRVTTVTTEFTTTPTPSLITMTTVSDGRTMTVTSTSYGPNETTDRNSGEGAMSSTAKTGIIAGACVAGALIVAAIVFFCLRYRRRGKQGGPREESHPMLPQYNKFGSLGPASDFHGAHSEISSQHTVGGAAAAAKWEPDTSDAKWRPSPDPWGAAAVAAHTPHGQPGPQPPQWDAAGQYQGAGWGANTPQQPHAWGYSPGAAYAPPPAPAPAPVPATYELAGPEPPAPAEMPATPLHHAVDTQHQGAQYQGAQYQGVQYQGAQYQGAPQQAGQPGWNGYNAYNNGR